MCLENKLTCLFDVIENGKTEVHFTSFAWRYTADHFSTVFDGLFTVEGTLFTGETLADHFGIFVDRKVWPACRIAALPYVAD